MNTKIVALVLCVPGSGAKEGKRPRRREGVGSTLFFFSVVVVFIRV